MKYPLRNNNCLLVLPRHALYLMTFTCFGARCLAAVMSAASSLVTSFINDNRLLDMVLYSKLFYSESILDALIVFVATLAIETTLHASRACKSISVQRDYRARVHAKKD